MFQTKRMLVAKVKPGEEVPHPTYVEVSRWKQFMGTVTYLLVVATWFGLGFVMGLMY